MLEISADHIAALKDDDLRTLIGRLCEAELRTLCLPTSAVTWGGHQNASDGGVDVRVALPEGTAINGFVPRPATGYQVKDQDMPHAKILKEMCPSGSVRPCIEDLANQSGAYVIISSQDSTSDTALRNRQSAMAEAIENLNNANSLFLDFYDRNRIATWVRNHNGLIPWVREKAGNPVSGWHSFGPWAYPSEGIEGNYLLDQAARIQTGKKEDSGGFPVLEGIKRIRALLREPRSVVRLVGLSGTGKTRLVQALFDARIGEQNLDPSLAIYANMADAPDPHPTNIASNLVNARTRNIIVVDNCPQDLHRRLSEVCRLPGSALGVITIEYDIQEDEPEETEVFKLESSSPDLIEKLVKHRFPDVSNVDARTIAQFSGGNARIAIALATTIKKNETIAGFTDNELFKRLFQQRHEHDAPLLLAAQACSLVYSFQAEQISGSDAELPRLGALIGKTAQDLFGSIAELQRRDLVQQRGVWRAVLPHAIANRLATMGLQNIPFATIEAQLINDVPDRLIKSFSRRLGYLHNCPEAIAIAARWLESDGLLGEVSSLNDLGRTMFNNIAPVAPDAVLCALERALSGPQDIQSMEEWEHFVPLLHSLAHESRLFDRCVAVLIRLAEAGKADSHAHKSAVDFFTSLFFLFLSGTHAPVEQRLRIIEALLQSSEPQRQDLGLKALGSALESRHFTPVSNFEFGARSRDYGYWPRTSDEARIWFSEVLKLVERFAILNNAIGESVRHVLAQQFRGLWYARMYEALERLCQSIGKKEHWSEGWIAARQTWQYDGKGLQSEEKARLCTLEQLLRPRNLVQRVRSIVLASASGLLELGDLDSTSPPDAETAYDRGEMIAYELGKEAATDERAFNELLPELVKARDRERLWSFGRGLAAGAGDPKRLWHALTAQLSITQEGDRSIVVFGGVAQVLNDIDPHLVGFLLDEAVEHKALAPLFPLLQIALQCNEEAVSRLHHAIALDKAPIRLFRCLAGGRWSAPLPGTQLKNLLLSIAEKSGGFDVAIEILYMRIILDDTQKRTHDPDIIAAGRELLRHLTIDKKDGSNDHRLAFVFEACLSGPDGIETTQDVCRNLKMAIADRRAYAFYHLDLVRALLKVHPNAGLDAFFAGNERERELGLQVMADDYGRNPVMAVPEDKILFWCRQQPEIRYPLMASLVDVFDPPDEGVGSVQWSTIATQLLEEAPQPVAVLEKFVRHLSPRSWNGSRAAIIEKRSELLRQLETHSNPLVAQYATSEYMRWRREVEEEKQRERFMYKAADERFE